MGIFKEFRKIDKYYKVVDNSRGFEKIRLIIRRESLGVGLRFLKRNGSSYGDGLNIALMRGHMILSDIFYGNLDAVNLLPPSEVTDYYKLADEIYVDEIKREKLSLSVYGAVFSIILQKAADLNGTSVNRKKLLEFISVCDCEERQKDIIRKAALSSLKCFNKAKNDGVTESQKEFTELAALLLGGEPLSMAEAPVLAYNAILAAQMAMIEVYKMEENQLIIKTAGECGLI